LAGEPRGADARPAAQRGGLDPGVVGYRRLSGRSRGGAGLDPRVLCERRARLGRNLDGRRERHELVVRKESAQLPQLVLVARGHDEPHPRFPQPTGAPTAATSPARSCSIPLAASARRSSSDARESGVRSAVACTSTSPPSPVMTTLASTSAMESSE